MKIKWIVITLSTDDKKYHCFDEVFDSKQLAEEAVAWSKSMKTTQGLHDWNKTRIIPIHWNSIINRKTSTRDTSTKAKKIIHVQA